MSWELFKTEVFKILYIRDYYKETIYNIIKIKIDLDIRDYYIITNKIIVDLKAQFENIDKEAKADAKLQNFKLYIRVKNIKETFNIFYFYFITIISLLDISEREKYRYLRRIIISRLKYQIFNYVSSSSYKELVSRLR